MFKSTWTKMAAASLVHAKPHGLQFSAKLLVTAAEHAFKWSDDIICLYVCYLSFLIPTTSLYWG